MVNIAIFASGNGSNFEQIINEIQNGNLDNAICKILIVDKENAYILPKQLTVHSVLLITLEYMFHMVPSPYNPLD